MSTDRDPTTPAPTLTGSALDAMTEAGTRMVLTSAQRAIDGVRRGLREGCVYRDRLLSIGEMDALSDLISARLAEPPTYKDGLQVAAPGDFEPAGRAIFVRLGASTIDAFHPAYEPNADLFEGAARDAIARRPGAARGGGRLREAARTADDALACASAAIRCLAQTGMADTQIVIETARMQIFDALAQAGQDAEGWQPIGTCPSKGEPVWVWRPDCHTPSRHQADGEYWRRRLREGSIYAPTHWCHDRVPTPPAQPSGDAS